MAMLSVSGLIFSACALAVYVSCLYLYRLFFDPLSKFPGPKLAAASLWYEFYYDVVKKGRYTWEIANMHDKYGMSVISLIVLRPEASRGPPFYGLPCVLRLCFLVCQIRVSDSKTTGPCRNQVPIPRLSYSLADLKVQRSSDFCSTHEHLLSRLRDSINDTKE